MTRFRTVIAAAAVVLAAVAPAFAQDTLKFKDSQKTPDISCVIGNLNYKSVEFEIEVGGTLAKQQADARLVAEIVLDANKTTFDFGAAQQAFQNGDFASAIERFERVRKDQRSSEVQKQMAGIGIARAQFALENWNGVLAAVKALRDQRPDTFFLRESYELEIKAGLARRDVGAAAASVQAFQQRAQSEGMTEWVKSGELMSAGLLELQGKHREALAVHRKYSRDRDVGDDATLGELRCLVATQDWTQANARAEIVLTDHKGKKNPNTRLLTAAFNARGMVQLQANKAREALMDFLQGAFVLSKAGGTSQEHEAALGYGALAAARVAAAEKDKAKKDTWKQRALELLGELDRTYPGSPLKGAAQKAVAEIK
jgi:hypothetical protein